MATMSNAPPDAQTRLPPTKKRATRVLIVCDAQPDVLRKLPQPRRFLDLVQIAVDAARRHRHPSSPPAAGGGTSSSSATTAVVHTLLHFDEPGYAQVDPSHPRLGVLRRLGSANPNVRWFTSEELSIDSRGTDDEEEEVVVTRSTYLPHAHQTDLMEALRRCGISGDDGGGGGSATNHDDSGRRRRPSVTVLGYGPTVQSMCHILGDVLAVPGVRLVQECIGDENEQRRTAFLEHGLLFDERVISLVDFLEESDLLHERIWAEGPSEQQQGMEGSDGAISHGVARAPTWQPPKAKYVCDCGRGGHLSLYLPYLLRDHGYIEWPTQPWYEEQTDAVTHKQYYCPLGRRTVDLCDEPQFSRRLRLFVRGREFLDEKNKVHELVPEFLPPTFDSIEAARAYAETMTTTAQQRHGDNGDSDGGAVKLLWFVKAVNQNGGRAVRVTNDLSTVGPLTVNEQLQVHVPRPLLHDGQYKSHVKTYYHISCRVIGGGGGDPRRRDETEARAVWQVYVHDLFYLATASRPWSTDDLSDDAQITTMRTHRLYPDDAFRDKWNLTKLVHEKIHTLVQRAVERGKLQTGAGTGAMAQFEVHSADWMLDRDGRVYLIECNGIPVLFCPESPTKQELVTWGLKLYEEQWRRDPAAAVVNDSDLVREALGLALTGQVPPKSLWRHVATIEGPALPVEGIAQNDQ